MTITYIYSILALHVLGSAIMVVSDIATKVIYYRKEKGNRK